MSRSRIEEPARTTAVLAEADVVVLGGGPSGIAAAAAAAGNGARTLLVERYGFLGGMGTAAMVTNFCGLHASVHGEIRQVVHGVADEILDRIDRLGGLGPVRSVLGRTAARCYDNAVYKCAADDLLLGRRVQVLFHALAVGAVMREDGAVEALLVETKSGRRALLGNVFIDCSGDADLAAWSGAPWESGPDLAFPTMMFRIGGVDDAAAATHGKPRMRELMDQAETAGESRFRRRAAWINPQPHAHEWRANVTQVSRNGRAIDGTEHDDLVHGEIDGRRQVLDFFAFLKKRVPGFESAYVLEIAPQLGIRETRRILGRHQLAADEVLGLADFEDAIGVNGWPIEKHVLGDVEWQFLEGRGYYQMPFRCLVPRSVPNLLVAGRCAGATHEAQASLRVSGPCFAMGQAAGTAAAMVSNGDIGSVDVAALRQRLRDQGAFLG